MDASADALNKKQTKKTLKIIFGEEPNTKVERTCGPTHMLLFCCLLNVHAFLSKQ